jgi:septum formation protein
MKLTTMANPKIIIASTSPRRKEIAQQIGLDFVMMPSDYEEDMSMALAPKELVQQFALGKATSVVSKVHEGIVLGIDTIVSFKGKNVGKPKTIHEARELLKSFSGQIIEVYSGIALIDAVTRKQIVDYELTKVHWRSLSASEIEKYIETGEPMEKAGAFAIQGLASIFIKKIDGCYTNVVGFPAHCIAKNLKKMGIDIFAYKPWNKNDSLR